MIHAGVLPWARTPNGPVFLLGRERSGKWCSFGGRPEENETIIQTAVREAWEESMGFLGTKDEIEANINKYLFYLSEEATVFGLEIPYDERLPSLYQAAFECTKNMTSKYIMFYNQKTKSNVRTRETKTGKTKTYRVPVDTAEGFLEKTEVRWFTLDQIRESTKEFRKQNLTTVIELSAKINNYHEMVTGFSPNHETVPQLLCDNDMIVD